MSGGNALGGVSEPWPVYGGGSTRVSTGRRATLAHYRGVRLPVRVGRTFDSNEESLTDFTLDRGECSIFCGKPWIDRAEAYGAVPCLRQA